VIGGEGGGLRISDKGRLGALAMKEEVGGQELLLLGGRRSLLLRKLFQQTRNGSEEMGGGCDFLTCSNALFYWGKKDSFLEKKEKGGG